MSDQPKLLLDYNSAYLNFKVLDELDFVIGGYGRPTIEFIFSLNTFIETFVLNNSFYTSEGEIRHAHVTNKFYFPHGRPIAECLTKEARLGVISGVSNNIATAVYVEKFEDRESFDIERGVENYFSSRQKQKFDEFTRLKTNFHQEEDMNLLRAQLNEDRLIIGASLNSPIKIYKTLASVSSYKNIHPVLPFNTLKDQVLDFSQGISNGIFEKLISLHNAKTLDLKRYFGLDYQVLPPLVSILLSQCKSITDIPQKLSQLRKDFTSLRNSISNYEKRVNEAHNVKEQLDAITEFNAFWETFHKKYDNRNNRLLNRVWEISKEADGESAFDNAVDNESTSEILKDLNAGKVAGKAVSKGWDWWKQRRILSRFKGITNAWELFETRPILVEQLKQIEKIFGLVVTQQELAEVKAKPDLIKNIKDIQK